MKRPLAQWEKLKTLPYMVKLAYRFPHTYTKKCCLERMIKSHHGFLKRIEELKSKAWTSVSEEKRTRWRKGSFICLRPDWAFQDCCFASALEGKGRGGRKKSLSLKNVSTSLKKYDTICLSRSWNEGEMNNLTFRPLSSTSPDSYFFYVMISDKYFLMTKPVPQFISVTGKQSQLGRKEEWVNVRMWVKVRIHIH